MGRWAGRGVWGGGKPLKVLRTIFKLLIRLGGTAEKIDLSVGWVQTADITTEAEVRERETELENLILKDSSIRSIWTYLTAGPCYTTNSRYHNRRSRRSRGEREREGERERLGRERESWPDSRTAWNRICQRIKVSSHTDSATPRGKS